MVNNCRHLAIWSATLIGQMAVVPLMKGQFDISPFSSIGIEYSPQKLITKKAAVPKIIIDFDLLNSIKSILTAFSTPNKTFGTDPIIEAMTYQKQSSDRIRT